jgi:hypothetical protein
MKKYSRVVAIGCSYTYGAEALEAGVTNEQCLTVAWPRVLADRLSVPVINLAISGASNDWIYYTLTNWMAQHPQLVEDSLIIVQWSFLTRVLTFKPGDATYYVDINPLSLDLDNRYLRPVAKQSTWQDNFWPRTLTSIYVDYLATDPRNYLNCMTNSLTLKSACASMGADFEYFSVQPLDKQSWSPISSDFTWVRAPYLEQQMTKNEFEWVWEMQYRVPGGGLSGGHFNVNAHIWWADKIFDYLNTGEKIA